MGNDDYLFEDVEAEKARVEQARIDEMVERAIKAREPQPLPYLRCLGCWRWSNQRNTQGVCVENCGRNGRGISYDSCIARRLGFGGPNSSVFYEGLAAELANLSKVSIHDLLNEELHTDEDISRLYDEHIKDGPRRPPNKTEKKQAEDILEERKKEDRIRTLKSQRSAALATIQDANQQISRVEAELAELEVKI